MKTTTLLALLLTGCVTGPSESARFDPPAAYVEWATELIACAGFDADPHHTVASIEWRTTEDMGRGDDWVQVGEYDPSGPTIYLLPKLANPRKVVKHELTHHLIDVPGYDRNHYSPVFKHCVPY